MSFASIRDQEVPIRLLRNAIDQRRVPNGMLFWGPEGVGKRLTAIEFAKALNCEAPSDGACGQCLACRKIAHGNHPDLHIAAPVKKSRIIDVDAINDIVEMASLRPYESQWRIFLIVEADRMRPPAQNHLLKTLEEPVGQSVFVLLTEFPQMLLPTIRSRCQRVRFGALRPSTVVEFLLRDRELTPAQAEAIAALSQGQMSRAFDLVDSDKRTVVMDVVQRLAQGEDPLAVAEEFAAYIAARRAQIEAALKAGQDPAEAKELGKEDRERIKEEQSALADALGRRDIMEHLYLIGTWYRDILVYSAAGDVSHVLNRDHQALLTTTGIDRAAACIAAVEKTRVYLERFLNEERVFRDLFFALAP